MPFPTSDFGHAFITEKAERQPVQVEILTERYKVFGTLHLLPGTRVTDYLNRSIEGHSLHFLPLTQVKIHDASNDDLLHERDFIEMNINHILWIHPLEGQAVQE